MERRPVSLVLDTSCLLNLYATGHFREIAASLREQVGVSDFVLEEEALFIRRGPPIDGQEELDPVDLSPFVSEGLVEVMYLESPNEKATFVDLSAVVDDGEAVTAALALHRGYSIAIDDRKARRVLAERAPTVPLVSTLELVVRWVENVSVPLDDLRSSLKRMRFRTNYVPGSRDPHYKWWLDIMQGEHRR